MSFDKNNIHEGSALDGNLDEMESEVKGLEKVSSSIGNEVLNMHQRLEDLTNTVIQASTERLIQLKAENAELKSEISKIKLKSDISDKAGVALVITWVLLTTVASAVTLLNFVRA